MKIKLLISVSLIFILSVLLAIDFPLSANAANPVSTNQITIIGDSITVRATPYLQPQLPNAVVDAAVSRPWSGGITALSQLKSSGKLYPTLVFALGTNNGSIAVGDINNLLTIAPGSKIILVTTYNITHPDWANNVNSVIKAEASAHPDVISIADWNAVATANPGLIDNSDGLGVHPTIPTGSQKFADVIAQAVAATAPEGGNSGQSAPVFSNCVITKIGNPAGQPTLPDGCSTNSSPSGSVSWPFLGPKVPSEFNRVDQGWDLEAAQPSDVLAVAPGTINIDHGDNPCDTGGSWGGGFGATYPIEVLDTPITVNGRTYSQIYYGHVADTKLGHVNAGDVIAQTFHCVQQGGVWVAWLEIGFWGQGGPVGQSPSSCGPSPATQAGCDMKQWLNSNTK